MKLHNIDVPPFPEGSDWTEPAPEPYDNSVLARFQRGSGLAVLWSSVLVFVTITFGLLRADTVVSNATNSDDLGELDGLNVLAIVVLGVAFGLLPLALALWHSGAVALRKKSRTRRAAGISAAYTALCGAVTTPVSIHLTAETDKVRRITAAGIAEATHIYWAVGLVALVPLVLFLLSLRSGRTVQTLAARKRAQGTK